jgi:hypothetical protein
MLSLNAFAPLLCRQAHYSASKQHYFLQPEGGLRKRSPTSRMPGHIPIQYGLQKSEVKSFLRCFEELGYARVFF